MAKGDLISDPRGLFYETYRMEGIAVEECRSIFFDWALGMPAGEDMKAHLAELKEVYGTKFPDHPMTAVIIEGLEAPEAKPKRRTNRRR